jgi:hypothetical protein
LRKFQEKLCISIPDFYEQFESLANRYKGEIEGELEKIQLEERLCYLRFEKRENEIHQENLINYQIQLKHEIYILQQNLLLLEYEAPEDYLHNFLYLFHTQYI